MSKREVKCPSCGDQMCFSFTADFKLGTADTDLSSLLNLPENNEGNLPLDVFVCSSCGKIDFYAGPEIKESLVRIADTRK